MIICRQCSHSNPDGTAWCQKCNSFLEFEGETRPGQSGHTEAIPAVTAKPPPSPPPVDPGPPTVATPANRGESLVARPGDAPPPADPATAPRQPAEPEPAGAMRQVPAPSPADDIPPIRPGEIVCPVCGWGNEPSRRFCRHDGAVLTSPGGPRGQADALKAGQRRRRSGGGRRWQLAAVAVLVPVLVAAAVLSAIYLLPGGSGDGDDKAGPTPTPEAEVIQIAADDVRVEKFSSQSGGRQASNLLDGNRNTFWSAAFPSRIPNNPLPDIDRRPRLDFRFDAPITLVRLEILNGASGAEFAQRSRCRRIIMVFPDGSREIFELEDQGTDFQTIDIKAGKEFDSVAFFVSTSYPGGKTADFGDRFRFSMAEVRFFQQK